MNNIIIVKTFRKIEYRLWGFPVALLEELAPYQLIFGCCTLTLDFFANYPDHRQSFLKDLPITEYKYYGHFCVPDTDSIEKEIDDLKNNIRNIFPIHTLANKIQLIRFSDDNIALCDIL